MMLNNAGISKSKFYMLRCLIAMAHADGVFHENERSYIEDMMSRMSLSEDQISVIREDMGSPQNVGELFTNIDEPKFRGQVVYFARLMAHKDGDFSPSEETLLERLHGYSMNGLDMEAIHSNVQEVVRAEMLQHEIDIDEGRPTRKGGEYTFFRWLDEGLQNIGIDLLQD